MTADQAEIVTKGALGTIVSLLAALSPWQEHVEFSLRLLSLGVGVYVGLYTVWSLKQKNKRNRNETAQTDDDDDGGLSEPDGSRKLPVDPRTEVRPERLGPG